MSMLCACGSRAACIDSRFYKKERQTRRRYECMKKNCRKRWTTLEIEVPGGKRERGTITKARVQKAFTKKALAEVRDEVLALFEKRQP